MKTRKLEKSNTRAGTRAGVKGFGEHLERAEELDVCNKAVMETRSAERNYRK